MAILDELIVILGYDVQGEGDLRRFNAGLDRAERQARQFAGAIVGAFGIGSAAFTAGLAAMGRGVIDTSAQFEGFETALTTIEGSSEKARESLGWISEFAAETPYAVNELVRSFTRLRAQGVDPIANDTLRVLGDTASALNVPIMQAVEALTDAQTMQFERLREFGITTSQQGDEVVFSFQKNGEDILTTVEKSGAAVRRFLLENFGERFGGAMENQSRTFTGITSNLGGAWTNFQLRVGEAGIFDAVKDRLASLLEGVDALAADGTLDRWAARISGAMEAGLAGLDFAAERLGTYANAVRNVVDYLRDLASTDPDKLADIAAVLGLFALPAWPLILFTAGIAGIALALDDLASWWAGDGETFTGQFLAWLEEASAKGDPAAVAVGHLARGVDGLTAALRSLFELLTGDLSGAMDRLEEFVDPGSFLGRILARGDELAGENAGFLDRMAAQRRATAEAIGLASPDTEEEWEPFEPTPKGPGRTPAPTPAPGLTPQGQERTRPAPPAPPGPGPAPDLRDRYRSYRGFEDQARLARPEFDLTAPLLPPMPEAASAELIGALDGLSAILQDATAQGGEAPDPASAPVPAPVSAPAPAPVQIMSPADLANMGTTSISNDNRVSNISVSQTVNQTVRQVTEAPAAAARATAGAMGEAARVHAEGVQ